MSGQQPQQILQNIIQQNPQARAMLMQMQNSGMPPRDFVIQYAKQNNINIQPLVNMLNQQGHRL